MAFSKSIQKGQIPVGCELCDGGKKIEYKCLDCEVLMCCKCKEKVHAKFKNAREHRVVDIKDVGKYASSMDTFNFCEVKCQEHPEHVCCVYCKTCKKVICLKCVTKVHNGHAFIDEEEFADKKKMIRNSLEKAERDTTEFSTAKEILKVFKKQEDTKFRKGNQAILDQRNALKNEVDRYADCHKEDLEKKWKSNSEEIERELNKIDNTLTTLQCNSNTVNNVTISRDFSKFFDDFDQMNVTLCGNLPSVNTKLSSLVEFIPGRSTVFNFGSMEKETCQWVEKYSKIEFKLANQYTTNLEQIHLMTLCLDGTMYVADTAHAALQHIKICEDRVEVMASYNIKVYGMAITSLNNLLISDGKSLQLMSTRTGQITKSIYDVGKLQPECVHITSTQNIIVGGTQRDTGRVIVMDQEGKYLAVFKHDTNDKALFTHPLAISSTTNGNIIIVDRCDDFHGVVTVLRKDGEVIKIYKGHSDINTEETPFDPVDLLTTPSDNIIIFDINTYKLHVISSEGETITFYDLWDNLSLTSPYSLLLHTQDHFFVGSSPVESEQIKNAKLFELEYTGI